MTICLKLGVLLSGDGSTFLNLHDRCQAGNLDAQIACVISSNAQAKGLSRAQALGYPTCFVDRQLFANDLLYSQAICAVLCSHEVDLVILAGFLLKFLPPDVFAERTLNIHPSLLPCFGGQGFYGMKVHLAVWARGCKVSGCTVHLVNREYDDGPIIVQKPVALSCDDSPEDIRDKVFRAECDAYPQAIEYFIQNRISFSQGRAFIAAKRVDEPRPPSGVCSVSD